MRRFDPGRPLQHFRIPETLLARVCSILLMGLLIHYHTATGKETVVRPSKHKTVDAKTVVDADTGVYIASRGTKFGVFNKDGQVGEWYTTKEEAVVAAKKLESKTADVMAGVTPSGHRFQGTGLRCDRCGRPRSAHFVAGEKEVEKTGDAETADASQILLSKYERYLATGKNDLGRELDASDRAAYTRLVAQEKAELARDRKTTDSALDLGYPVNREWVRLSDAMAPADAAKELAGKFTPEQMDAWRANY